MRRSVTFTPIVRASRSIEAHTCLSNSSRPTRLLCTVRRTQWGMLKPLTQQRPPHALPPRTARQVFARNNSSNPGTSRELPLRSLHERYGAKWVPFGGFSMPLQYQDQSHIESHHWTRKNASLFDVSHMVQHTISGPNAKKFLERITPASLDALPLYRSTLSCLLLESGGIVDDTVITRLGDHDFYLVTNAGRAIEDADFILSELTASGLEDGVTWDRKKGSTLLAFQGPRAAEVLQPLLSNSVHDADLSTFYFGQSRHLVLKLPDGTITPEILISRTGYTGEDGFEIAIIIDTNEDQVTFPTKVAEALLGDNSVVRPAGLAARDSLRLEAGMCLYGHDLDESITPPEAALGWAVQRREQASANFNGAKTILPQLGDPKLVGRRRVGMTVEKGPPAREGAEIVDLESGKAVGNVTSGLPSPTLGGKNIAMGYVQRGYHKKGTKLGVKVRKSTRQAEVVKMPFVENKFHRPA